MPVDDYSMPNRIYNAFKASTGRISGYDLYEAAYRGIKPASYGTFLVSLSNLNKRLRLERGVEIGSTTWYGLFDAPST